MILDLQYPTSWGKITSRQLFVIAERIAKPGSKSEILFDVLCKITGLKPLMIPGENENTPEACYFFRKKNRKYCIPIWIIRQACEEMSFIVDSTGLTASPIDVNPKLHGVTFKSFYFADAYLSRYNETKDVAFMKLFIEELCEKRYKVTPLLINAIYIWWIGLKDYLRQLYPEVLRESDVQSSKSPADNLHEILSHVNKGDPSKNQDILKSEMHAVMLSLNDIYLNYKQYANR